jgi:two-component system cell cycle sensor histidine kinase/response regulator CckA
VEIRLEDDGEGMNEETLHRAFDPFFTTKDVGQGTGLGLSTAFGTITRLGGTIEAESALGAGSTFTIWLPVADGTPDTVEAVAPVGEFDGQLILVVEDELVVREAVVRALRAQGCRVVEARDGAEAIECFESHRDEIDLVFCDVGLPKMSGVHVVRQIVGQRPDVRIVFTTGYSAIARDELDALSSAVL